MSARPCVAIVTALALGGCGLARMHEQRAQAQAAWSQYETSALQCNSRLSEQPKDAVARADCLNRAEQVLAPYMSSPDLFALRLAKRSEIAERYAHGAITKAQANLEFAELEARTISEVKNRTTAAQSVAAQRDAANAAWSASRPKTCIATGTMVTCQ